MPTICFNSLQCDVISLAMLHICVWWFWILILNVFPVISMCCRLFILNKYINMAFSCIIVFKFDFNLYVWTVFCLVWIQLEMVKTFLYLEANPTFHILKIQQQLRGSLCNAFIFWSNTDWILVGFWFRTNLRGGWPCQHLATWHSLIWKSLSPVLVTTVVFGFFHHMFFGDKK